MRELPILFSTPMVQAIQADTKNQTRRTAGLEKVNENPNDWELTGITLLCKGVFGKLDYEMNFLFPFSNKKGETVKCKPRYQKGDRIWVKETYQLHGRPDISGVDYVYRADKSENIGKIIKWKSSLFMPKKAARTWLICLGVRCERLLDISKSDAINEGILYHDTIIGTVYKLYAKKGAKAWDQSPVVSYMSLWDAINGEGAYLNNPWVFIYDFKRIEK